MIQLTPQGIVIVREPSTPDELAHGMTPSTDWFHVTLPPDCPANIQQIVQGALQYLGGEADRLVKIHPRSWEQSIADFALIAQICSQVIGVVERAARDLATKPTSEEKTQAFMAIMLTFVPEIKGVDNAALRALLMQSARAIVQAINEVHGHNWLMAALNAVLPFLEAIAQMVIKALLGIK